jgi:hypothetical protein
MPQLKLRKFDMASVKNDSVVIMLGKRRTGKSFLVRDLLSYHTDMPSGVVISGTEASNGFFGKIFPPVFIHDEFKAKIIENLIKRQKGVIRKINANPSCNIDPRCILLMDDCLYDKKWANDENIRQIMMNGRHLKLFFILTSQYPLGVPPNLRSNIDYVFILRENIMQNRRRIYENYCGMLPTFDIFCSVLDQTTENYECLVVDNTSTSNKIEDCLYYYRAEDTPQPFTIGSRVFWNANNKHLNQDDEDDEEPFDFSGAKKRSANLVVKKT